MCDKKNYFYHKNVEFDTKFLERIGKTGAKQ